MAELDNARLRYQVAFSFAGTHRDKVRAVAEIVSAALDPTIADRGQGRVFFDEWFEHSLGGDRAEWELQQIYGEQSLMIIADVSNDYSERPWCQAEADAIAALRMSLDSARKKEDRLRLAYVRFDKGAVPGVLKNAITWDAEKKTPQEIADLILKRLAELNELLAAGSPAEPSPVPVLPMPLPAHVCFFHPATNDSRYALRGKELAWLDDCAKSESTRIATITGQGGLGKTSLTGHWIEKCAGWRHRGFQGVFFFSFYSERDPAVFFAAFLEFVCKLKGWQLSADKSTRHTKAAGICTNYPFLIVLDGLEVLQHGEDDPAQYGWINHTALNEFVCRVGGKGWSLLVLTSRFPFHEIARECPGAMRPLELPLFTDAEGASLLESLFAEDGRRYDAASREAWSHQLGGHPLALRLFAGACLEQPFSTPEEVIMHITAPQKIAGLADPDEPGLSADEQQKRRQRRQFYRLLGWYQQKLSEPKRRLLQLVALFRDPVSTATLIALATGLDDMQADFAGTGAAGIRPLLDGLARQSLLQEENAGVQASAEAKDQSHWSAHPIVRDVFREAALSSGKSLASQFAAIVGGKSGRARPRNAAETLPIIQAIEVLLAAGDFKSADALYTQRLQNGKVLEMIPTPELALRCARAFIEPRSRQTELQFTLGAIHLACYLASVSGNAFLLGETRGTEKLLGEAIQLYRFANRPDGVSSGLQQLSEHLHALGRLRESAQCASEAVTLASQKQMVTITMGGPVPFIADYAARRRRNSLAYLGQALSRLGKLPDASRHFIEADHLEREETFGVSGLSTLRGIQFTRHLIRIGAISAARAATELNYRASDHCHWEDSKARCILLLGELDLHDGDFASAATRTAAALQIFRAARMGQDLPAALLACARVRHGAPASGERSVVPPARRNPAEPAGPHSLPPAGSEPPITDTALDLCDEAVRAADRCGLLIDLCDALNFRARLHREAGNPDAALADAVRAEELATACEYYWGHHEALRQLRDTHRALGNTGPAADYARAEEALTKEMAPRIEEALAIHREHDAAMEKLYGKKA